MRDFKYPQLVCTAPGEVSAMEGIVKLKEIKSDCLRPCAEAFAENMTRTFAFAVLPLETAFQSSMGTICHLYAHAALTADSSESYTLADIFQIERTPQFVAQYNAEAEAQMGLDPKQLKSIKTHLGLGSVLNLLKNLAPMQLSMDALLTSITLESWLFFEAMASDLWALGVDHGGKSIVNRVTGFSQWEREKSEENPKLEKAITSEFNAKTHPGSFLREMEKVSFSKLHLIIKYYGAAFGDDARKIFDKTSGGYIHALNAARNLIVHSAGRVDAKFVARMERFPDFPCPKEKERLLLDGEIAKRLRASAIETGLALFNHVDDLLQSEQ